MSRNDPTGAEPAACPYVGLADDPAHAVQLPGPGPSLPCPSRRRRRSTWLAGRVLPVESLPDLRPLPPAGGRPHPGRRPRADRRGGCRRIRRRTVGGVSGTSVPQAWPTDVTTPRAEPAPPLKYRLAGKPERTTEPEFAEQPEPMPGPERLPGPEPVSGPEPEPENEPALASSPEPSPEAGPPPEHPGVAAGQATPDAGSGLPPDWWQPEATHATAGLRPASPPPTAWKTATTSSVLASIIPLPEPPIVAPPSESETPDREPDATEAVAKPLPSWLTEATSAAVTVVPYPKTEEPAEAPAAGQATAAADASSDRTAQTTDSAGPRAAGAAPPEASAHPAPAAGRSRRGRPSGRGHEYRLTRSLSAGRPPWRSGRAVVRDSDRDPARRSLVSVGFGGDHGRGGTGSRRPAVI